MPVAKLITRLCLFAALLCAALVGVVMRVAQSEADAGIIVFDSNRIFSNGSGIYMVNSDGDNFRPSVMHLLFFFSTALSFHMRIALPVRQMETVLLSYLTMRADMIVCT